MVFSWSSEHLVKFRTIISEVLVKALCWRIVCSNLNNWLEGAVKGDIAVAGVASAATSTFWS